MNGPIRRVAFAVFGLFGVLAAAVTYLQVIAGPDYRDDPRNVRVLAGQAGRERGTIITSDGTVVARSVSNPDDPRVFRRSYPENSGYAHAVGYSTLLFGPSAWRTPDLTSSYPIVTRRSPESSKPCSVRTSEPKASCSRSTTGSRRLQPKPWAIGLARSSQSSRRPGLFWRWSRNPTSTRTCSWGPRPRPPGTSSPTGRMGRW